MSCAGAIGARTLGACAARDGRDIGRAFFIALPALALPFLIRAAVVEGVATATEVSTIGIAYSAIVGLAHLSPLRLGGVGADAGLDRLPVGGDPAHHRHGDRYGLGPDAVGLFALLGCGNDRLAGRRRDFHGRVDRGFRRARLGARRYSRRLCCSGRCCSRSRKAVGIHEVHYAMVVILAMGIGLFAPPFGVGYYAACAIGRVEPAEGMRPILAYMLALVVGTVIVAAVPWISIGFLR